MKGHGWLVAAGVLALVLGVGVSARMYLQKKAFDETVREALETSEGYDQRFIDMVNRLEEVLATRASFGYTGRKDPMTGKVRSVARPLRRPKPTPSKEATAESVDPFKLTAIIFDDEKRKHTAIIMHGERSFAVDVGDVVEGRGITRITDERVYMEDSMNVYYYDINGRNAERSKLTEPPK